MNVLYKRGANPLGTMVMIPFDCHRSPFLRLREGAFLLNIFSTCIASTSGLSDILHVDSAKDAGRKGHNTARYP